MRSKCNHQIEICEISFFIATSSNPPNIIPANFSGHAIALVRCHLSLHPWIFIINGCIQKLQHHFRRRITLIRKLKISLIIHCCQFCMHASMPPKWTSRRLRGYPPESQERFKVGSADKEALPPWGASPPPGSHMKIAKLKYP